MELMASSRARETSVVGVLDMIYDASRGGREQTCGWFKVKIEVWSQSEFISAAADIITAYSA